MCTPRRRSVADTGLTNTPSYLVLECFWGVTSALAPSYVRSSAGEFELRTDLTNSPAESNQIEDPLRRPRSSICSLSTEPIRANVVTWQPWEHESGSGQQRRQLSGVRPGSDIAELQVAVERRSGSVRRRLFLAVLFSVHQPHPIPKLPSGRPEPTRQRSVSGIHTSKTPGH